MLAEETGARARTLQWFLTRYGDIGSAEKMKSARREHEGSVLVLDESSMVSTAQMELLMRISERLRIARLVLVGDRGQLRAVTAGEPFRALQDAGVATAEMDEIMRQRDPALKRAVERLQEGRPAEALGGLPDVCEVPTEELGATAARLWLELDPEQRAGTAILAPTHFIRAEIHRIVREGLGKEGVLHGRELEIERFVNRHLTAAQRADVRNHEPGEYVIFHSRVPPLRVREGDACRIERTDGEFVFLEHPTGRTVRIRPGDSWVRYRFAIYETARIRIRAGDRIRWTNNDKKRGLVNGGEAAVSQITSRRVRFDLGNGETLPLPRDDVQLRHIDHAWSSTVHAAQGMTRDAAIAVLDTGHGELSGQAALYVEASRARDRFVLVTDNRETLADALEENDGAGMTAREAVGEDDDPPPPGAPPAAAVGMLRELQDDWRALTARAEAENVALSAMDDYARIVTGVNALSDVTDLSAELAAFAAESRTAMRRSSNGVSTNSPSFRGSTRTAAGNPSSNGRPSSVARLYRTCPSMPNGARRGRRWRRPETVSRRTAGSWVGSRPRSAGSRGASGSTRRRGSARTRSATRPPRPRPGSSPLPWRGPARSRNGPHRSMPATCPKTSAARSRRGAPPRPPPKPRGGRFDRIRGTERPAASSTHSCKTAAITWAGPARSAGPTMVRRRTRPWMRGSTARRRCGATGSGCWAKARARRSTTRPASGLQARTTNAPGCAMPSTRWRSGRSGCRRRGHGLPPARRGRGPGGGLRSGRSSLMGVSPYPRGRAPRRARPRGGGTGCRPCDARPRCPRRNRNRPRRGLPRSGPPAPRRRAGIDRENDRSAQSEPDALSAWREGSADLRETGRRLLGQSQGDAAETRAASRLEHMPRLRERVGELLDRLEAVELQDMTAAFREAAASIEAHAREQNILPLHAEGYGHATEMARAIAGREEQPALVRNEAGAWLDRDREWRTELASARAVTGVEGRQADPARRREAALLPAVADAIRLETDRLARLPPLERGIAWTGDAPLIAGDRIAWRVGDRVLEAIVVSPGAANGMRGNDTLTLRVADPAERRAPAAGRPVEVDAWTLLDGGCIRARWTDEGLRELELARQRSVPEGACRLPCPEPVPGDRIVWTEAAGPGGGVRTVEAEVETQTQTQTRTETVDGHALALRVIRAAGPGAPEPGSTIGRAAGAVTARGCFRAPWADEARRERVLARWSKNGRAGNRSRTAPRIGDSACDGSTATPDHPLRERSTGWRAALHPRPEPPFDLGAVLRAEDLDQQRQDLVLPALPDHVAERLAEHQLDRLPQPRDRALAAPRLRHHAVRQPLHPLGQKALLVSRQRERRRLRRGIDGQRGLDHVFLDRLAAP